MPLSKEESEEFLDRVEKVLVEEPKNSYYQQRVVLLDGLDDLILSMVWRTSQTTGSEVSGT